MRAIDADELLKQQYKMGFGQMPLVSVDAIKNAPALTPPNEWVSVEDRLPENEQEVLVYWRNTSQKAEHFEITHYTGNHWFLLDNANRPWIEVIAWMPMPEPPEARG